MTSSFISGYNGILLSIANSLINNSKNSILESKYSFDKKQTSYDDLLDALRLSLKGYQIE